MQNRGIITDLEGVILNIDYQQTFKKFASYGIELKYDGTFQQLVDDYDSGAITTENLFDKFKEIYCKNKPLRYQQFVQAWNAMLLYIPDENLEYLHALKKQGHKLVLLSNINELHMQNVHATYGDIFEKLFDKTFYSFQIHALKPKAEAFEIAIQYLESRQISRENILFIDDMSSNIDAAKEKKLSAIKYPMNGQNKNKQNVSIRSVMEAHVPLHFNNNVQKNNRI